MRNLTGKVLRVKIDAEYSSGSCEEAGNLADVVHRFTNKGLPMQTLFPRNSSSGSNAQPGQRFISV